MFYSKNRQNMHHIKSILSPHFLIRQNDVLSANFLIRWCMNEDTQEWLALLNFEMVQPGSVNDRYWILSCMIAPIHKFVYVNFWLKLTKSCHCCCAFFNTCFQNSQISQNFSYKIIAIIVLYVKHWFFSFFLHRVV